MIRGNYVKEHTTQIMESLPVTLIVKAPNQQFEDQTIKCEPTWSIRKLKGYLSEVYPCNPVSILLLAFISETVICVCVCLFMSKIVVVLLVVYGRIVVELTVYVHELGSYVNYRLICFEYSFGIFCPFIFCPSFSLSTSLHFALSLYCVVRLFFRLSHHLYIVRLTVKNGLLIMSSTDKTVYYAMPH